MKVFLKLKQLLARWVNILIFRFGRGTGFLVAIVTECGRIMRFCCHVTRLLLCCHNNHNNGDSDGNYIC